MEILKIENKHLTGYYLEGSFRDEYKQTGLAFIDDPNGIESSKIEFHYKDKADLEKKLSYILMILTDK